jgi:hypothetical protein
MWIRSNSFWFKSTPSKGQFCELPDDVVFTRFIAFPVFAVSHSAQYLK